MSKVKTASQIADLKVSELVQEINELVAISKTRKLNDDELAYQKLLRQRYVELYKQNLVHQLDSVKVVDKNGQEIKLSKKKKGSS